MGSGVAKNLIKAGHDVYAWDTNKAVRKFFINKATIVEPHDMAGICAMIIFVVPGSTAIDAMLKGKNSLLKAPREGLVLYDFTTSEPAYTKKLARRAGRKGVAYLDAGMTRGANAAVNGTLSLMIGGDERVLKRTAKWLEPLASKLIYLGESGSGHTMKVIHNM